MMRRPKIARLTRTIAALALLNAPAGMTATQVTGRITQVWANDSVRSNVAWILTDVFFTGSCGNPNYIIIDLTQPGMKEVYAMALSAFHTDANVTIGTDVCYVGYERLKFMYLLK